MVETRSGKMQDPAQERIQAEESAKPQPGATIGRDASSDPVVLNPNIDIPKYDGTEDPRPWIESLEEIGFLYHWADYIISRYAAMNMIGSAKTWLNLHKVSFTSWENFKSRLIEDFASDANKEEMRMRLNRIQQWNEPAIRFAEDILVLCNKVDPQMEEETKINWVIGGLKKEYSFALHLNPPKNTNELLEICKKLDLFEKNYQERAEKSKALYNGPRSPRPHHQEQWKNATSFRRPYQNTYKPQAPAPRYYQNTSKPQAPTPRYYQNKPLPQVSAPRRSYTPNPEPKPVYPSKIYNKNPNSNRNRTEDGRPICFKCNKPGHVARYCRVRSRGWRIHHRENHKMFQTNGLRLARSLINVVNKETYIWITNPYPRPLKILKNQTLCFGSQPAEVNLMEESEQKEHEEPQFQINENLAYTEKEQLKQVLERYEDLFSSGLGRSNLAKHRIDTEGAKPIKHKPYRVSAKEREIIKEQIDEMLRDGIIRPSSSPWSFPVILVKKRDGKYRFCVDYRKLNDVTVKDVYPIPRIDEVLDTLQGSKYFSAIDLKSGYWQVEVEEKDKEKTAFTTAHGLYEFNVMPFGLCNAPATFERNMENMLGNLRWQICLCYLDDVIIYSSDFSTHLKRIEAVLKCFREANLKLNNKKCQFAFEELEILGHITNQHGIKPAEHNIKAIRDFPRPKKIKEVQSFLGMCSYYRKFIKGFSKIADPLTSLIKKNVPFTWTENQEKAFQTLKVALINPPILGHFDPNAITYIHTDASNIGLGATLVQKFGDKEKVISYLSRTLSKPEQNYSTTEKECLAVVWSMSKLRPYLYGRHFKIVTDHHALCWLKNLKDPTGRLARWALKIQEYNFEIIHKSGKKHLDADGLSRGPLPENEWDEDYERLFLNQIIDEKDDFIENIKENLSGNKRSITQNFKEENGCLYKKNPNPEGRAWLLVVPKKRRKEVMSEYHNHMLNGHLGVARTTYRLKNKYYWPSMLKDVSEFVKTCHLCQSRKGSNHLTSGLLQPIPPANYPFERIGIDFVGPLPSTKRRRKWIIVLTDYYTKYAETKAVSEATVKEVSTFLIEHIILRHGAPRFLISDRGSQFTSNLMKEVMKMCKVKHCFTTSYHPQTNGLTERLNRTLINMISMYVNTDQKNWDEILPFITHAYNTTIQETTGYSPFFLLFGREPMSLLDDENIPTDSNMDDYDEYIENYLDKIARTRQVVINNTEKTQERMKRNYDKKHNEKIYEPGHLVAVWTPVRKIGKCEKLLRKYFGPYRILKKLSNVNYLIEPKDNPGQDPLIVHVSRLKPYFERIDEVTHEDIQPPETFDFSTPNEWPKWRKRFERYLVDSGMKKKEEADKIDLLMYLMGDRADDIFRTFRFEKEEEATKIDSVLKAFDSHFCVRKNIIYERAKFNSRIQEDREPVDEFITSLYKLADSCEFESLHEQLIRDRIVVGVRDKALSERMQLDSELTLEKAVKMVRQQEAVRQQQVDLQRPSTSQKVNQVRFNSRKLSPKQQQQPSKKEKSAKTRTRCPKCGGFTHREGQACRAEGKRCNLCSKTGHFANCCPDKQAKTAEVKAVSELDEEIGFLLDVSAVEDSSNIDDDEGECRRRWTAEIQVKVKQVKFKLDSQADVTCVPLCLFKKIMGQQRLVESDINIRADEFSELQTVGMFISTLRNGNYEIKEKIYVIRRLSEPLLSRRACELLNLARRIEVVATKINPIKEFSEVFEGLGQIGNPYEIKLKPGAKPYAVHTPRRVPIPLMEKLKTRLMPFGISLAPEYFQRVMSIILQGMDGVMCYLDDILIFASDSKTHDRILRLVLRKLKEAKVSLNKAKCVFGVPRINFLGHILDKDGIRPDPAKIEAVAKMPAPTDVHGVRRFLGMVNHLGRFVENLSEIVAPLNQLLVKGQDFVWDCSQERAFRKLKELLTTQPILAAYDVRKPTMVSSDASSYGLGAVLKQEGKNGIWRPVAYSSITMTPTEKRYAQIEKEALAITWACERFQDFLLGKRFRIETDHKPLIPLFSTKELSSLTPRLQRFRMRMMRFGFEIVHIPGKELLDADALSRQPLLTTEGAQQEDTTLKAVVNYLEQGWPDKKKISQALLSYWHVKDELGVQNGLLRRSCRLVIPASMKLEVLDKLHAGHFGITKTRLRARETVWWPGISEEIAETVRKCSVCIQEAVSKHEPLIPTKFPTRPWQKIGIDLFKFENKWYLVVIDYYSRFPEMIQLDRLTANVVVRSCKSIFARHGIPETVVSDNGTQFGTAREFANFARQYGFTHVTSSPRFPQSNGMAEAGVKIAKLILKKNQDPSLGLLEYRSTPLENGYSPAELLMGRKLRTTLPIAPDNLNPGLVDSQTLKRKEERRRKDMKSRYDRRCGARDMEELSEGDTVWITDMRIWGIIKQKASTPRSYRVDTPVGTVRRNRFHLRKGDAVQYPDDPSTPTFSGEELVKNEKTPVVDYASNDSDDGQIRTRIDKLASIVRHQRDPPRHRLPGQSIRPATRPEPTSRSQLATSPVTADLSKTVLLPPHWNAVVAPVLPHTHVGHPPVAGGVHSSFHNFTLGSLSLRYLVDYNTLGSNVLHQKDLPHQQPASVQ
ncbi:K02A2.6-like, partial [Cordylochernes scorpioides]